MQDPDILHLLQFESRNYKDIGFIGLLIDD